MKTLHDTGVLFGRSMRHIVRSPDTIITVTITPLVLMLLFVYVFGGAIQVGTDKYVQYLLPGILLIAIGSGIAYTSLRLFSDVQQGLFSRFHSMPIRRSAILWGHVLTSLVSNAIPPWGNMNQEGWQKVLDFSIGAGIVKDRAKAPAAKEGVLWTNKYEEK